FFQAEDGIRDFHVTGVQTCALPILSEELSAEASPRRSSLKWFLIRKSLKYGTFCFLIFLVLSSTWIAAYRYINPPLTPLMLLRKIGRASCRERASISAGALWLRCVL